MIDFLVTYWAHILIGVLFVAGIVLFVINQRKNVKEWLLLAVIEAEKALGAKMGKIKLRQVYDWFINTFPIISKIIPFSAFSSLVDVALVEMEKMLEENGIIKEYISVGGGQK